MSCSPAPWTPKRLRWKYLFYFFFQLVMCFVFVPKTCAKHMCFFWKLEELENLVSQDISEISNKYIPGVLLVTLKTRVFFQRICSKFPDWCHFCCMLPSFAPPRSRFEVRCRTAAFPPNGLMWSGALAPWAPTPRCWSIFHKMRWCLGLFWRREELVTD